MKTIKISPSQLNSFARYSDQTLEYETLDRLMDYLTKPFVETPRVKFGKACHALIEDPSSVEWTNTDGMKIDGEFITHREAKPLLEFRKAHPDGVFEVPWKKLYEIDGYKVVLSQRIDMMEYDSCYDFKIVERTPKAEDYMRSYQWRCYLDGTELETFIYKIWQRRGRVNSKELVPAIELPIHRHVGLHDEVCTMISRFIHFLELKELIGNFKYEIG